MRALHCETIIIAGSNLRMKASVNERQRARERERDNPTDEMHTQPEQMLKISTTKNIKRKKKSKLKNGLRQFPH